MFNASSDSVAVYATSSDSTVLRVSQPKYYILKNAYYTNPIVSFVGAGTARIVFTDSAGLYRPDSTTLVTVTGPSLQIANGNVRLGMRQKTGAHAVDVAVGGASGTGAAG